MSFIRSFVRHRPAQTIKLTILTIALAAFMTGDALLLQALIANVEAGDWHQFARFSAIIIGYIVVQAVFYFWRQSYAEHVANLALDDLRASLFSRTARVPLAQYARVGADRYLSDLTVQLDGVKANLIDVAVWGFYLAWQLVFAVAAILSINSAPGLCALLLCIPPALTPILSKRAVETARRGLIGRTNDLNETTSDLLHGMADWRLADRGGNIEHLYETRGGAWLRAANHDADVQKGVDAVNDTLTHALMFGVWIIGGLLIMRGSLSVAQIIAFISLTGNISVPLFYASGLIAQYHAGRETLASIEDALPGAADDPTSASAVSPGSGPLHSVELRGFRAHAASARDSVDTPAVDLTFDCSGRYVVVGRSGAGKSSLVRPLFGLDDDYAGGVLVDGRDVRGLDPAWVAARVGLLSQSSHLFRCSIRENVRLFDDGVSDAKVLEACERAHIGDWVRARGLDAVVDDGLNALSGGERQRLLLARLLVRGCRFGVFDEPTVGLDGGTAALVEDALCDAMPGFVLITHRLDPGMLSRADAVVVVEDGRVAAMGPFDQVRPDMVRLGLLVG